MLPIIRRLFNIYPGEEKKAFLFALLAFTWALGVTCGVQFSNAVFLLNIGAEQLPTAYSLTACGLIVTATFLLYSVHVASPYRILAAILTAAILFYATACLFFLLEVKSFYFWFALKVGSYLFFSVVITSFWLFIDQYFHLQDAKRLFGLFSSFIFIGAAVTGLLLRSAFFDSHHLIMIIASLLAAALILIRIISSRLDSVSDDTAPDTNSSVNLEALKHLTRSILTSRFTIFLLIGNFTTQLLLVITEYNVLSAFQERFGQAAGLDMEKDTEALLTTFMGQWVAIISVCNLIFGLFIYSRLVRRFGVTMLVFTTPLILFITFSGWLSSELLLFPIMGYFVVEGTLIVIDDSNFSLLLNAVPQKVKYKIRVIIESFFEPIGMLTSSLMLAFLPLNSRLLGLLLSGLAICVAFGIRRQYLPALFRNLNDNVIRFNRRAADWFAEFKPKERKSSEYHLLAIFRQGDEQAKIFAGQGLLQLEEEHTLRQALKFAEQMEPAAKIHFLNQIEHSIYSADSLVLDCIRRWLIDVQDPMLKSAMHLYLAKKGLLHPDKVIGDLEKQSLDLRAAAIIALRNSIAQQSPSTLAYNRTVASQELEILLDSTDEAEVCMGIAILGSEASPGNADILIPFLKSPSVNIARAAAGSLAKICTKQTVRHVPALIAQLSASTDNELRLNCLKALGKMADSTYVKDIIGASIHFRPSERRLTEDLICHMGLRTVPVLLAITKDGGQHDRCRTLAGRALARLAQPQLRANLFDIIHAEIERAYFYYYHAHLAKSAYPQVESNVLVDGLLTGYHSVMDFIIQILGSAGSIEDAELLSRSHRSKNIKIRSQVVEALEKTCDTHIFRLLHPLVADLPIEEKMRACQRAGIQLSSLQELLDWLSGSPSVADQIIAASYKFKLDLPGWRESLRKQMASNEQLFHHFAYELLETPAS